METPEVQILFLCVFFKENRKNPNFRLTVTLLPFGLISCVHSCYSLQMAITDVAGERVYRVKDIAREFLCRFFVH